MVGFKNQKVNFKYYLDIKNDPHGEGCFKYFMKDDHGFILVFIM